MFAVYPNHTENCFGPSIFKVSCYRMTPRNHMQIRCNQIIPNNET